MDIPKKEKEVDIFIVFIIGVFILVVGFIVLSFIEQSTAPETTYKIEHGESTYYSDSYEVGNGFVTLKDYDTHKLFLTQHYSEPLVLQGDIQIIKQ